MRLALRLFRRHVADRSGNDPGSLPLPVRFADGESKVDQHGLFVRQHHHVGRLDVPVDGAVRMGVRECIGQLRRYQRRFSPAIRFGVHPIGKAESLKIVGHDVAPTFELTHIEHGDDSRMAQLSQSLRLFQKLVQLHARKHPRRNLDGDLSFQSVVESKIDRAETARPQDSVDFEAPQRGGNVGGLHRRDGRQRINPVSSPRLLIGGRVLRGVQDRFRSRSALRHGSRIGTLRSRSAVKRVNWPGLWSWSHHWTLASTPMLGAI